MFFSGPCSSGLDWCKRVTRENKKTVAAPKTGATSEQQRPLNSTPLNIIKFSWIRVIHWTIHEIATGVNMYEATEEAVGWTWLKRELVSLAHLFKFLSFWRSVTDLRLAELPAAVSARFKASQHIAVFVTKRRIRRQKWLKRPSVVFASLARAACIRLLNRTLLHASEF